MIAIVGPTASGKTARGVALARELNGEIVSADSRQIYCGMDIGTGKDLEEYGEIPYHLIDIAPAGYRYNLYEYIRDARAAIKDIRLRGKTPIIVGGTGLYIETLLKGITLPEVPADTALRKQLQDLTLAQLTTILQGMKVLHNTTDVDTPARAIRAIEIAKYYQANPHLAPVPQNNTPEQNVIFLVDIDRENRRRRISERLHTRLTNGMVEEVKGLLEHGIPAEDLIYYGLEYKFITLYLIGQLSYTDMVTGLEIAIHQFAKRQATWFRGMERRGFKLHPLSYDLPTETFNIRALQLIESSHQQRGC